MRVTEHRQRLKARVCAYATFFFATPLLLFACDSASADAGPGNGNGLSAGAAGAPDAPVVRAGVEVLLSDSIHLVRNRAVGLVTNHTGIDRSRNSTIDLLFEHADIDLVSLFSPEHGIRGAVQAGVGVASGLDDRTGLPIYSLYGETRKPNAAMLEGIQVVLFDIQDIGARYYTYVYTMALAMEAAGEAGVPFVVLDRPNPIGGTAVQGAPLDPAFSSFVGMYPIPMRHGMTPGELARMFVGEFGVQVDLTVVPVDGWQRDDGFAATGLPWIAPSPNMPSPESAMHYPGTCLFEGTALSVGRGTDEAFQVIGAPWLDADELLYRVGGHGLPGVTMEPVTFTPQEPGDGKFADTAVHGLRFTALGPEYDPTRTAVAVLIEARALAGENWSWRESHFDRLAGSSELREGIEAGVSFGDLTAAWAGVADAFKELRAPYLLYP